MDMILVNRKHKLLQSYLHKVKNLIKYMYDTMLIMQPVLYIYTQGMCTVSQCVTNSIDLEKTWCYYYGSWYILCMS